MKPAETLIEDAVLRSSRIVGQQAADNFYLHLSHQAATADLWEAWLDQVLEKLADHVETELRGWEVIGAQEVLIAQMAANESFFARFTQLWQAGPAPIGGMS